MSEADTTTCPRCGGTGRVPTDPVRPVGQPFDRTAFNAQRRSMTREDSARKPKRTKDGDAP